MERLKFSIETCLKECFKADFSFFNDRGHVEVCLI